MESTEIVKIVTSLIVAILGLVTAVIKSRKK